MSSFSVLDELDPRTRFLIVQAGCYAFAVERFERGEPETYYAQRYTVDFVAEVAKRVERATVLDFTVSHPVRKLSNGVYGGGVELYPEGGARHLELLRMANDERPTHTVIGAPLLPLVSWSLTRRMRTISVFADSFTSKSPKEQLKYRALAAMLNTPRYAFVANHNLAASLDLARIGVKPEKIIPYDWPAELTPADFPAKPGPSQGAFRLIYVGMMHEDKGVGDAIRAVALLRERGRDVSLTLVGGDNAELAAEAHRLGVQDHVHFAGRIPHTRIVPLMHEHDAVLVPTRHSYPEGLPMTIYEGLCSRSPVIVSDHPMFRLRMRDGETGLVFKAASEAALADTVMRLLQEPGLYAALSDAATRTAEDYLCPMKWDQVMGSLLSTRSATRQQVMPFSLAGDRYGPDLLSHSLTGRKARQKLG